MDHRDSFASLFQLPNEHRIQLAQDLWESVSPAQDESPVPEWALSKLRERKGLFDANPIRASRGTKCCAAQTTLNKTAKS